MAIFRGTGSASATTDQTTIDTTTQNVVNAEAAQEAAEAAQTAAETAKTNAENLYGDLTAVQTAKTAAETAASTATTKASEASDDASDAQKLAIHPVDSQFTLSDGSTTGYSALHYNTQTQLRYDNFDDRYLGSKDVAPTVDNDGDPLITGAMYFNNVASLMYVWTENDEWVNVTPSSTVSLSQVTDVTATASEVNVLDVSAQTPTDGQVLTYTTAGGLDWTTLTDQVGISNLVEDTTPQLGGTLDANGKDIDMGTNTITDTKVGQWDTAYGWGNHASAGYLTSLAINGVSDITITTPADNEVLAYDNTSGTWINQTASEAGLATTTDITNMLESSDIGVTVQAYDADTLKADVADTLTAPFRGTVTTDNDLSFDMSVTNHFKCTPTANGTLTFTNITAGQSGNIWLDNSGAYTISAAASTYIASADLTTISTAGVYFLSYYSDGTNVMVSATPAVTSAGA